MHLVWFLNLILLSLNSAASGPSGREAFGGSKAPKLEQRFPACINAAKPKATLSLVPVDPARACQTPKDDLRVLTPILDKAIEDENVKKAMDFLRPLVVGRIQKQKDARETLLLCLNGGRDPLCAKKIAALKTSINKNMQMLRMALALSRMPDDPRNRAPQRFIRLPNYVGGGGLPPLSAAELKTAVDFQNTTLLLLDRRAGRDEQGRVMDKDEFIKMCQRKNSRECLEHMRIERNNFIQFRQQMEKIASRVIGRLPMIVRFSQIPVTDKRLKEVLTESRDSLGKWIDDLADESADPEVLLMAFPDLMNEILAKHPEFCDAVNNKFQQIVSSQRFQEIATIAIKLGTVTGACLTPWLVACVAVAASFDVYEIYDLNQRLNLMNERYAALSAEEGLISPSDLKNGQTEYLIKLAFASVQTAIPIALATKAPATRASAEAIEVVGAESTNLAREAIEEVVKNSKDEIISQGSQLGARAGLITPDGNLIPGRFGNYLMRALEGLEVRSPVPN